jgi:hypothetical protein
MKRTLTAAAAVLASGAGAIGFAAAANAAETPQLPAELPTDNNLAQTAYHFGGTLHSANQAVGDVVPLERQLAGRTTPGGDPLGDLTGLLEGTPVTSLLGGVTGGKSLDPSLDLSNVAGSLPVGDVVPAARTLPAPKTGGPTDDLLSPVAGSTLNSAQPGMPQTKPAQVPEQNTDLGGEALDGVLTGSPNGGSELPTARGGDPLGGITDLEGPLSGLTNGLPIARSAPADPLEDVNDLLSHGPLGGTHQLGG